jgi:putative colanic acid biosynthesis UDP-glucose lipid carrier transferase
MQLFRTTLYFLRISLDIIILIFACILASYLSTLDFDFFKNVNAQFLVLSLAIIWFFTSKSTGLYDEFRSRNFSFELILVIKNCFIQGIGAILILFLLNEKDYSRYFVVLYVGGETIAISVEKFLFSRLLYLFRRRGRNLRHMLIIGTGETGTDFYNTVKRNTHFGYNILGFLDDVPRTELNGQYLGKINELDGYLNTLRVDDVIIALPSEAAERIDDVIGICEKHTTRVKVIPDYFNFTADKYNLSLFGRFPVISVREDKINELHWRLLKRGFDILVTLLLFIFIFWWLWPLIALIIKVTSPGPVFYKQERWGRDNRHFITYKFRTMHNGHCNDTDEDGKYQQATKDDPRVTKIGRILRKTNLDELPQFWNVLRGGEMSIVGPRPHPTPLNMESKDKVRLYMFRHLVKPGITGWAQINGYRGETTDIKKMQKRIDHDIWYIENWSFWLDIQIIALTVWNMIKGDPNAY